MFCCCLLSFTVVVVEVVTGLFTQWFNEESVARPKESVSNVFVVVVALLINLLFCCGYLLSFTVVIVDVKWMVTQMG